MVPRLQERYKAEIAETLMKDFQYDNVMQIPKLVKVVINRSTTIKYCGKPRDFKRNK